MAATNSGWLSPTRRGSLLVGCASVAGICSTLSCLMRAQLLAISCSHHLVQQLSGLHREDLPCGCADCLSDLEAPGTSRAAVLLIKNNCRSNSCHGTNIVTASATGYIGFSMLGGPGSAGGMSTGGAADSQLGTQTGVMGAGTGYNSSVSEPRRLQSSPATL